MASDGANPTLLGQKRTAVGNMAFVLKICIRLGALKFKRAGLLEMAMDSPTVCSSGKLIVTRLLFETIRIAPPTAVRQCASIVVTARLTSVIELATKLQ